MIPQAYPLWAVVGLRDHADEMSRYTAMPMIGWRDDRAVVATGSGLLDVVAPLTVFGFAGSRSEAIALESEANELAVHLLIAERKQRDPG